MTNGESFICLNGDNVLNNVIFQGWSFTDMTQHLLPKVLLTAELAQVSMVLGQT